MNAKPKSKFTFAGRPVVEGTGTPRWETRWGYPLWMVAAERLSDEEEKIAVCHYVFGGGEPDPGRDGWLAYEED